jgi:hypothetical protein
MALGALVSCCCQQRTSQYSQFLILHHIVAQGLKLVFNKGEGTLRVTGNYGMPGSANRAFDGEADW